jgi:hypothetical protein
MATEAVIYKLGAPDGKAWIMAPDETDWRKYPVTLDEAQAVADAYGVNLVQEGTGE